MSGDQALDELPRLPDFVRDRLPAIRQACQKYHVQFLYLYGSAVTGAFEPGQSDLDFMVEFTPAARDRYDGHPKHYFRGMPTQDEGAAYPVNYRALAADLAEVFADRLTYVEGREEIDIGTYSCINNEFFKRTVDSHKIELYARRVFG